MLRWRDEEMKLQEDIEDNAWRYALYDELLYMSDQKDTEIVESQEDNSRVFKLLWLVRGMK